MKDLKTISWIFLATALASKTKSTDIKGIISIADGINHALPSEKELKTSIDWLTKQDLITRQGKNYELTDMGKTIYGQASIHLNKLMDIWKELENQLSCFIES